jgi:sigma-B regulation protein RsbU (phosphoserine phosphatase)
MRPATDHAELAANEVEKLCSHCEHLSAALGWRIHCTPIESGSASSVLTATTGHPPSEAWTGVVHDGLSPVAIVRVLHEPHTAKFCSVQAAVAVAEILVQRASDAASMSRALETRTTDLSTLVHLGLSVQGQQNLPWSLSQLLRAAVELTATRSSAFFLLTPDVSELKLRGVYQITPHDFAHPRRPLLDGSPELVALTSGPADCFSTSPFSAQLLPASTRSALCVAVASETVPIGTLWVYDRRDRRFDSRDRHVLQSIAAQFAAVLERAALLQESETTGRINRELRFAQECEPNRLVYGFDAHPELDVAARCSTCYELGGDLIEFLPLSEDRFGVAIGDASGNSIPAAMIMSAVRGALRTNPADASEIAASMAKLNRALHSLTRSHQFMSLCYGVIDASRRTFTYCNAGHPTPLWVRGDAITPLESHGLLLGVLEETGYEFDVLSLQPGDLLVFYSDGISEARDAEHRMFRGEGIADAVRAALPGNSQHILDAVWNRVESHMSGGELPDDRALMVIGLRDAAAN